MSLISLPNGNFVCGTDNSVILLNEKLQNIKEVYTGVFGNYCSLNRRNEIYVSVNSEDCIYLFDYNLNQLKKFGSYGAGINQLNFPEGLCCHEDYLYICDRDNRRIQIFTLDFEYVSTIKIDCDRPRRIQISEKTIGVSCVEATFFYDLKSKILKYKYNYATNLNYIDSIFYGSHCVEKKFYLFDSDGNFIEEVAMNENISKYMTSWLSGSLCRNKDDLYMTDYSGQLLKFTK